MDYLVLPLPFPLSVPLPSVRGESGGLVSGGVSLPFRLPCLYLCPFLCPFLCPWEGLRLGGGSRRHNQRASHQEGLGECGYVIPPGRRGRTFKAGAGMLPEGPCAGKGPTRGGRPPGDGNLNWFSSKQTQWLSILSKNKQNKETPGQHSLTPSSRRSTPTRPNFHNPTKCSVRESSGLYRLG